MSPKKEQETLELISWLSKQIGKKDVGVQCEEMLVESVVRGFVSHELGWELLASNHRRSVVWQSRLHPSAGGQPFADEMGEDLDVAIHKPDWEKPKQASFGKGVSWLLVGGTRRSSKA